MDATTGVQRTFSPPTNVTHTLSGPLTSIFSTSGVGPQRVELPEPVDVSDHGIHHGLAGVIRQRRDAAADPHPVVLVELPMGAVTEATFSASLDTTRPAAA